MDYKQKYEQALEYMRKVYPTLNGADKEDAEHYFPELKESEDERVRKTLIEHIKGITSWDYFLGISKEQMIAWLEKQGEQSFEEKVNEAMREVEEKAKAFTAKHKGETTEEILAKMRGEQKPAEWSENDELNFNQAIYVCHQYQYVGVEIWLKSLKQRIKKRGLNYE